MAGLGFLLSALTAGVTIPNIPASPPPRLALGEDDVSGHELGDWPPADPSIEGTEGLPPEGDDHARQ